MITEFGKLLRIIRINTGDSAKEMSKKLNISQSYLSAIENGNRNIPSDMENLLIKAYPLSDYDKEKLRSAMIGCSDTIKINLVDFEEEKKQLIFALVNNEVPNDKLNKMYELIQE